MAQLALLVASSSSPLTRCSDKERRWIDLVRSGGLAAHGGCREILCVRRLLASGVNGPLAQKQFPILLATIMGDCSALISNLSSPM